MTNKNKSLKVYSFVLYGRKSCKYCLLAHNLLKNLKQSKPNIKIRFIDEKLNKKDS